MKRLSAYLADLVPSGVALAFSGGTDSALLLGFLARLQRRRTFPWAAFFFRTPFQTEEEEREARCAAERSGAPFATVFFDVLQMPALRSNPRDRCYWCKHRMFSSLKQAARERGLGVLMDGTNADDLQTYRPGLRALRELRVVSPLAESGWGKKQVRVAAARLGLAETARKPSTPCLATRFPYGEELTEARLRQVSRGEALLRRRFPHAALRLRVHGDLARIELPPDLFRKAMDCAPQIVEDLRGAGFCHVTLDLAGFCSGRADFLH